ncbi:hypothetical protein [Arsenophonus sp. PmNCSU2021_1]|uniref:hypothetical protein n=1 Tax=Arsenophonus sp. PmNCSU2021_1 TaxID=3118989 RepID=UPI002FF27A74
MLFYEMSIRYSEQGILARDFYVSTNGRLLRQGKRVTPLPVSLSYQIRFLGKSAGNSLAAQAMFTDKTP